MNTKKAVDDLVSAIGSEEETNGLVKNEAALKIEHLVGSKAAMLLGDTINELKNNPQQYSVVFKDKGLRLKAVTAIAEKARVTDFPKTSTEVYDQLEGFMAYCEAFAITPTLGLFSTWLGCSIESLESAVERYKTARPDVAEALQIAKELLRGFLETKTLDGDIPPAVYLHQNKAYFGAVETAPVRVKSNVAAHVRDEQQIAEILDTLPIDTERNK